MGLFEKMKKAGVKPSPEAEGSTPNSNKGEMDESKLKVKSTTDEEGNIMITGTLPEGIDLNDPGQVKKLVKAALKKSGALPEVLKAIEESEPSELEEASAKAIDGLYDSLIAKFRPASVKAPEQLAIPQDPLKADFTRYLNQLHNESHRLGALAADLLTLMRCLSMAAGAVEQKRFKRFESAVLDVILALGSFGHETCSLVEKVEARGIPVADASTLTVN